LASRPERDPILKHYHRIRSGGVVRLAPFERDCPVAPGSKRARYRGAVMGTDALIRKNINKIKAYWRRRSPPK
jgi:hypothetical protein